MFKHSKGAYVHTDAYRILWNLFNVYKDIRMHFNGVWWCVNILSLSPYLRTVSLSPSMWVYLQYIYTNKVLRAHISNEKHLPQLMLLGYMPLWQELQTFDILGFQRAPSPTSCMTHVWDIYTIRFNSLWFSLMLKILQWFFDVCSV